MLFGSYQIFVSIMAVVIVFFACKFAFRKRWLNSVLLLLGNVMVLTLIVKPRSLLILSLVALIVYGVGVLLHYRRLKSVLALALTVLLAFFALRNYPLVQEWFGSWWDSVSKHFMNVEKIGLSYILFKMIHWMVENYRQKISSRNFLVYLNFLFFFPTFMAGPIDTFENFCFWTNKISLSGDDSRKLRRKMLAFNVRMLLAGVGRILMGAVKTLLIVPLLLPYATDYNSLLATCSPWNAVILASLLYTLYIYIDFSGYSDIAIGLSYMLGIRTPENFDSPYFASNISDFWKRWHKTFSGFLRMYVFKPTIALLNRFAIRKHKMFVSVCAYLITFFVCGIWHGSTANFVLWGLWHGVGLSVYKICDRYLPIGKIIPSVRAQKVLGVIITFCFVSLGWIFFNYPIEELKNILILLS
ncbi:MAG: MBOAT family protein [Bacteroidales bacterium]|nr:MBOAT family protein [Bacteroidales bacterium]